MTALETIQPYVAQLFEDDDVHDQLARAAKNLRHAKARAGRAKSTRKAVADEELRHRIARAAGAAWAAGVAISEGPQKRRRRSRRGQLLLLGVAGAAGFLAVNESARSQLLGLVRQEPEAA